MKMLERNDLIQMEIPPDTREILTVTDSTRSKVRKWAFDNAYTLIFIAVFFVITWIINFLLFRVFNAG